MRERKTRDRKTRHHTARVDNAWTEKRGTALQGVKDCARRFALLKLTTDRHEASRGLFATAQLLVFEQFTDLQDNGRCFMFVHCYFYILY